MPDSPAVQDADGLMEVSEATDDLFQAQALFTGDVTTGSFPAAERAKYASLIGGYQATLDVALPELEPAMPDTASPAFLRVFACRGCVITRSMSEGGLPWIGL